MNADRPLRAVFMGTPAFALPVLSALLDADYGVVGVYTQPDRRSGRGRPVVFSEIKSFALEQGLPVFQPASLKGDEKAREELASLSPDLIVVAAYGLFLPAETLGLPRLGCLNVHPSLLPRHRGPSPVAEAILNGDAVTGVTVMLIDEGMDSGPVVVQHETPIWPKETADQLTTRLFRMGAGLLVEVLPRWERGEVQARPQDNTQATITRRLNKEDGEIDWSRPAAYIDRQVRAYHPWPGSFTYWRGRLLKIIQSSASGSGVDAPVTPGQVVLLGVGHAAGAVGIGTGDGILEVRRLQLEGRGVVAAPEFASGHRDFLGSTVGR